MRVVPVARIAGALLFEPTPHRDERGFFSRTFDADVTREAGIDPAGFVQDSLSRSARGVVRGLHSRRGRGEAKLVRCSYGAIFDVIVDLRPDSPTYRNWESFEFRDTEQVSLYIPAGCAHGFQALTEPADVSYRIDRPHDPAEDVSIAFDDPELSIPWPLPVTMRSQRDQLAEPLEVALKRLGLAGTFKDQGLDERSPPVSDLVGPVVPSPRRGNHVNESGEAALYQDAGTDILFPGRNQDQRAPAISVGQPSDIFRLAASVGWLRVKADDPHSGRGGRARISGNRNALRHDKDRGAVLLSEPHRHRNAIAGPVEHDDRADLSGHSLGWPDDEPGGGHAERHDQHQHSDQPAAPDAG